MWDTVSGYAAVTCLFVVVFCAEGCRSVRLSANGRRQQRLKRFSAVLTLASVNIAEIRPSALITFRELSGLTWTTVLGEIISHTFVKRTAACDATSLLCKKRLINIFCDTVSKLSSHQSYDQSKLKKKSLREYKMCQPVFNIQTTHINSLSVAVIRVSAMRLFLFHIQSIKHVKNAL